MNETLKDLKEKRKVVEKAMDDLFETLKNEADNQKRKSEIKILC